MNINMRCIKSVLMHDRLEKYQFSLSYICDIYFNLPHSISSEPSSQCVTLSQSRSSSMHWDTVRQENWPGQDAENSENNNYAHIFISSLVDILVSF